MSSLLLSPVRTPSKQYKPGDDQFYTYQDKTKKKLPSRWAEPLRLDQPRQGLRGTMAESTIRPPTSLMLRFDSGG